MDDRSVRRPLPTVILLVVFLKTLSGALVTAGEAAADLTSLSIEELMNLEVISATKKTRKLADTASAAFVITQDDIRRSGATSIPEALRLAPGVQVARINANRWAVTIRGFNGRYANKLLVLVDGRSIYTPVFAGVYWEIQDLLMEDIERIEVIRGPGASLWGANAVNGVINIITKPAADTKGLVSATVGDQERATVGVRYGGQLGENAHYRLYGKFLRQEGLIDSKGRDAEDDWRAGSGGFRLDWTPDHDSFSLQGNVYNGDFYQNLAVPSLDWPYAQVRRDSVDMSSRYLQGRWERRLSDTSRLSLQAYYQNLQRKEAIIDFDIDTFNLDFQHAFSLNQRHALLWGLEYRHHQDHYHQADLSEMQPSALNYDLFSGFVQDQIDLIPEKLELTLGGRLEHNDFTGWEFQPNARLLWTLHPQHRLWASVSRAVRTPSRADDGIALQLVGVAPQAPWNLPGLVIYQGNTDFASEKVTAYELGYRTWPMERVSLDLTAFYNDYEDLRTIEIKYDEATLENGHVRIPAWFVNASQGETYGFEMAANWRMTDQWRLQFAYSWLKANLSNKSDAPNLIEIVRDGSQPRHQLSLLSSFDIRSDLELDLWLRYTSDISDLGITSSTFSGRVDDYFSLNARLGWRPRQDLELSLVGTNLLGSSHVEVVQEIYPFAEQVERSIYGQVKWQF